MNERIKEFAEQASNEIADLFRHGFFDQRMVDDLTKIIQTKIELAKADEREACAKLCEEREEYSMPIPCPDGISGCCVAHFVRGSKLKDGRECAAAFRGRTE